MRLVVDTNILFTFFWKNPSTKSVLTSFPFELYSPQYSLTEIRKHTQEILSKARITMREFNDQMRMLRDVVKFIPEEKYTLYLKEAASFSPDKKDIDFFALCLLLHCSLWSNDQQLQEQKIIGVYTTKDLALLATSQRSQKP